MKKQIFLLLLFAITTRCSEKQSIGFKALLGNAFEAHVPAESIAEHNFNRKIADLRNAQFAVEKKVSECDELKKQVEANRDIGEATRDRLMTRINALRTDLVARINELLMRGKGL